MVVSGLGQSERSQLNPWAVHRDRNRGTHLARWSPCLVMGFMACWILASVHSAWGQAPGQTPSPKLPVPVQLATCDWTIVTNSSLVELSEWLARDLNSPAPALRSTQQVEQLRAAWGFLQQAQEFEKILGQIRDDLRRDSERLHAGTWTLADLETRRDILVQRRGVLNERMTHVRGQQDQTRSEVAVLQDLVNDDTTFTRLLAAFCKSRMVNLELELIEAERVYAEWAIPEFSRWLVEQQRASQAPLSQPLNSSKSPSLNNSQPTTTTTRLAAQPVTIARDATPRDQANRSTSPPGLSLPTPPRTEITPATPSPSIIAATPATVPSSSLTLSTEQLRVLVEKVKRQAESLTEKHKSLQEKLELLGLNDGNQVLLLEAHRTLPAVASIRIESVQTQQDLKQVNWDLLQAEERVESLRDTPCDAPAIPATTLGAAAETPTDALATAEVSLQELRVRHELLIQLTTERSNLIKAVEQLRDYLDRQLLWVKNTDSLSWREFWHAGEGLWKLAQPQPWWELGQCLWSQGRRYPAEVILLVGSLIAWRWSRSRWDPQSGNSRRNRRG